MRNTSRLKGAGYLMSIMSVILLAIPAIKSAREQSEMLLALLAGIIFSVIGMAFRWRSHRLEQKSRDAGE